VFEDRGRKRGASVEKRKAAAAFSLSDSLPAPASVLWMIDVAAIFAASDALMAAWASRGGTKGERGGFQSAGISELTR
jgi:hypothetical protein